MSDPESKRPSAAEPLDETFEAALKETVQKVVREHRLSGNQILRLSSELQRLGVHRLIEERLNQDRRSG